MPNARNAKRSSRLPKRSSTFEKQSRQALDALVSPAMSSRLALVDLIRQGFPLELLEGLADLSEIDLDELVEFGVIPRRTLSHSRQNQQFSPAQSDRAVRFFRILQRAKDTFGAKDSALEWLKRPTRPLNGHTPIELLDTEAGARMIEDLLTRIDHGIAA
jgi:putative toxin-antitoxin system antitoxin component (TIGR02293 family)